MEGILQCASVLVQREESYEQDAAAEEMPIYVQRLTKQLEGDLAPLHKDREILSAAEGAHLLEPLRVHEPDQRDVGLHVMPACRAHKSPHCVLQFCCVVLLTVHTERFKDHPIRSWVAATACSLRYRLHTRSMPS